MIKRPEIIDLALEGRLEALLTPVASPDFSKSNCIGVPAELFFEEDQISVARAKQVCKACPIMDRCAEWASSNAEAGVFGGLTAAERVQKFGVSVGDGVPNRHDLVTQFASIFDSSASEVALRYAVTPRTVVRWRTILRPMGEVA